MRKISIAIPFYNNSKFLEDCLRVPLLDPRVDDIMINDDCSTEDEYNSLLEKLACWSRGEKFNIDSCERTRVLYDDKISIDVSEQIGKVRVERNDKNMLSFRNKYKTVWKAKNEWVYLLDSDNYLVDGSINAIYGADWDPGTLYMPNVLLMDREDELTKSWDDWNYRRFGYDKISLEEMQHLIHESLKRPPTFGLDGLLGSGNFFFNRDTYLKALAHPVNDPGFRPLAACSIAACFAWYASNHDNTMQIIPDLMYYHRLHKDSLCHTHGQALGQYADQLKKWILNIKKENV